MSRHFLQLKSLAYHIGACNKLPTVSMNFRATEFLVLLKDETGIVEPLEADNRVGAQGRRLLGRRWHGVVRGQGDKKER